MEIVENNYQSPARPLQPVTRRLSGWTFYRQMAGIVWRSHRKALAGSYGDAEWVQSSLDIVRALERAGVRLNIENVRSFRDLAGPCVFIGNHMSTLETFVLPWVIQPHRKVAFVVKAELLRMPIFKDVMASRNPVVVGRSNPRDDLATVLKDGAQQLAAGISMILFPQTTRTATFDPARFNSIGVKLARAAGVPVIPLALQTDAWSAGRWLKDFGPIRPERPVRICFGPPLPVRGRGREEHEAVTRFIGEKLAAWRANK